MTILLTNYVGFLGSHFLHRLLKMDYGINKDQNQVYEANLLKLNFLKAKNIKWAIL